MNAMTPTRIRFLVALAVIASAIGWGAVQLIQGQTGRMIPVPWTAAWTMWILAVALLIWGLLSRPRLLRKPGTRPMPPLVAARTAALAMAASRTGSLVAGFYAGIAIGAFPARATEAGNSTMWAAMVTMLGSILLAAAALWLERMCRLPSKPDEDQRPGSRRAVPRSEPGGVGARVRSGL